MRLIKAVQCAPNQDAALALIQNDVAPELQELLDPKDAEMLNQVVLKHIGNVRTEKRKTLRSGDLYGALACFFLVFVSCLPAAIPFVIFSQPHLALRVSNLLLIILLFLVGQKWARYVGSNRLVAGLAMVGIGLSLVGLAILLGG